MLLKIEGETSRDDMVYDDYDDNDDDEIHNDKNDDQDLGTAENSNCINSYPIMNPLWTMVGICHDEDDGALTTW